MSLVAFSHEIFSNILEFYVLRTLDDHPDVWMAYCKCLNILLVSTGFRDLAEKAIFKYLIVSESSPQTSTIERLEVIDKNKDRLGWIFTKLMSHGGLSNGVRRLGLHMQYVDGELINNLYGVMRLCPRVTEFHLNLHVLYAPTNLNSVLKQMTSLKTTYFYGSAGDNVISPWNIVEIILLVQGCSNLECLIISPDGFRSRYFRRIGEDLKLDAGVRSLEVNNVYWNDDELSCLSTLLPNLEKFHGAIDRGPDSEDAFIHCCLPGKWPSSLAELDLRVARGHILDLPKIDTAICKLSKLRILRTSAELLCPEVLLGMPFLENISYLRADISHLTTLAASFRRSLSLGGSCQDICLPAMKSFKLEHCRKESGLLSLVNEIRQLLKARGVKFEACPTQYFRKMDLETERIESVLVDVRFLYDTLYSIESDISA